MLGAAIVIVGVAVLVWPSKHQADPSPSTAAPITLSTPDVETPHFATKESKPARTVEVCGVGKLPVDDGGYPLSSQVGARMHQDALRWRTALLDSGDVRARAVGLLIDVTGIFAEAPTPDRALPALVDLAQSAQDPMVYSMALSACREKRPASTEEACQQITSQGWTSMDPDNASAWLQQANDARLAHDTESEKAAFERASNAKTIERYNWSLWTFAEPLIPSDITPVDRDGLITSMFGMEASLTLPATVSLFCTAVAMQDDVTRGQCGKLAELMVAKGTTVLDLGSGTWIGERAGWPETRIAALREDQAAMQQAHIEMLGDFQNPETVWSCDTVNRRNAFAREWAQRGEIGASRELLDVLGESKAVLAERNRELSRKMFREAAEREATQQAKAGHTAEP
jgi:hypothetical protein